jgi:hypothetical protein
MAQEANPNLLRDPKEEYDLILHGVEDAAWIMPPVMERVIAHQVTLRREPPIPLGTPDPYVPGGRN